MPNYGGNGVQQGLRAQPTNIIALAAGETYLVPSGWYMVETGTYIGLQSRDSVTGIWRQIGSDGTAQRYIYSDGFNTRLANQSGCVVGALLTNAGSGYTSPPTVAASAGSAVFQAIIGGALSTTVTVQNGGTAYMYPPLVQIAAPPSPGIQATGVATISGGVVTGVTIVDQGAGYTSPPTVSLINDSRDTNGSGAQAVSVLTGAGTITGILVTDHGSPLTAVPTLTMTGGGGSGGAATAIMNFAITAYGVTTAGAGYTAAAGFVTVSPATVPTAGTPVYANPTTNQGLVQMRPANILAPTSAAGAITATGEIVLDGGCYQAVPTAGAIQILGGTGVVTTAAVLTLTVGGLTDRAFLQPA